MTLEQRIEQGKEAERLLDADSLLSYVFRECEATYMQQWAATADEDVTGRERIYSRIMVLRDVRAEFHRRILDGKIAERKAQRAEREELMNA